MFRITYLVNGSWGHDECYANLNAIETILNSTKKELLYNFEMHNGFKADDLHIHGKDEI